MDSEPTVDLQRTTDSSNFSEPTGAAGDVPDLSGRILANRYTLIRLLGSGGMGRVFKALDWQRRDLPEPDRHVALKILRQETRGSSKLFADLRREFYCAQSLSHPNIVKVFELVQEGDVAFFTMELLSGELLSTRLKRTRPQPPSRQFAWSVIRDIGSGIAHAHSRHVVHGDLKPQNIMITRSGEIRILDFGASGSLRPVTSETAHALQRDLVPAVTPAYTCCELLDGQRADPRDDLFALACLSYELLSGNHPFQGRSSVAARKERMVPPRPPDLTNRQWRMLQQGLAWRREDRAIDVSDWLANLGPQAAAGGPQPPTVAAWGRIRHVVLGFALLASVGLLLTHSVSPTNGKSHLEQSAAPLVSRSVTGSAATSLAAIPADDRAVGTPEAAPAALHPRRPLRVWAESNKVLPGERFAQITVARSVAEGRRGFTWWTEGSTAKPGSDFVAQNPTTQFFTQGRRSTTLFVRLLPSQSRKNSQLFYVAIGKPGGDVAMARTAVWIPSQVGEMVAAN